MISELDQPIWALVDFSGVICSQGTYNNLVHVREFSQFTEATIVTQQVADKIKENQNDQSIHR